MDEIKINVFEYLKNDLLKDRERCIHNIQDIADIFGKEVPLVYYKYKYYKYKGQLEYIDILISRLRSMKNFE